VLLKPRGNGRLNLVLGALPVESRHKAPARQQKRLSGRQAERQGVHREVITCGKVHSPRGEKKSTFFFFFFPFAQETIIKDFSYLDDSQ
jgi:hypothetical protein